MEIINLKFRTMSLKVGNNMKHEIFTGEVYGLNTQSS